MFRGPSKILLYLELLSSYMDPSPGGEKENKIRWPSFNSSLVFFSPSFFFFLVHNNLYQSNLPATILTRDEVEIARLEP